MTVTAVSDDRAFRSLDPLLRPKSIAVVGASEDLTKIGGRPIRYLLDAGYPGDVYPINPNRKSIGGLTAYPSVSSVGKSVDLAVIALPADATVRAVEECANVGVRSIVLLSSGFAEKGEHGRALQRQLATLTRQAGIRVLGPNCLGGINVADRIPVTFSPCIQNGLPEAGNISVVSQSGAFASYFLVAGRRRGLGFSQWLTTGNELDIDVADCLAWLATDPRTAVVVVYVEGVRDGRRFLHAARRLRAAGKHVVALKAGSTEASKAAALSHTDALVGSDAVYDAAFRQLGVHRVHSVRDLINTAYALSRSQSFRGGRRTGILSTSGGFGIVMTDQASSAGLDVAPLPPAARERISQLWPAAGTHNPVDTTAQVVNDPGLPAAFLGVMLDEGDYDIVVSFQAYVGLDRRRAEARRAPLAAVASRYPDRLKIVTMIAEPDVVRSFEDSGFLVFEEPSDAVAAAAAVVRGRESRHAPAQDAVTDLPPVPSPPLAQGGTRRAVLDEQQTLAALRSVGIPVVDHVVVTSAAEAVAAAASLGGPVALKVLSADIPHKSDVGGVLLDLAGDDEVRLGYERIMAQVRKRAPHANVRGLLVSRMAPPGIDMILGVHRDEAFGPVVVCGFGGTLVELMRDVAMRVAPFGPDEARRMVAELRGFPLLRGARGAAGGDIDALAATIARLSEAAAAWADSLQTLDVNPVRLLPEGGVVALDGLAVFTENEGARHAF